MLPVPDTHFRRPVTAPDKPGPPEPGPEAAAERPRQTATPARADQRSRLLAAIVEVAGATGYPQTKIGDIASRAGVSRATFYELFENKEACFLAAHRELTQLLTRETATAVAEGDPAFAATAVFAVMANFADRERFAFNFLTHEAMVAGRNALDERDRLIRALEQQIEHASERAPRRVPVPDVPARMLLGGFIWTLNFNARRGRDDRRQMLAELVVWINSYRHRSRLRLRDVLAFDARLVEANRRIPVRSVAPEPLPRGRHRLPAGVVKRVQRERILHATAEAIMAKGYASTTVADIVAVAGLSREVFYAQFRGKAEAFVETHRLVFEQMMASTAGAFFASGGSWLERVWEGMLAFVNFVVTAPAFAHFGFVESYALGPDVARRTDDAILAFTVFLADGYSYRPEAAELPGSVSDAIAGAAMETVAFYVRHDRAEELIGVMPLIVYMVIAPFTGVDAAREFIERKVGEAEADLQAS
jgi:AcrR family transcriptional regulator